MMLSHIGFNSSSGNFNIWIAHSSGDWHLGHDWSTPLMIDTTLHVDMSPLIHFVINIVMPNLDSFLTICIDFQCVFYLGILARRKIIFYMINHLFM